MRTAESRSFAACVITAPSFMQFRDKSNSVKPRLSTKAGTSALATRAVNSVEGWLILLKASEVVSLRSTPCARASAASSPSGTPYKCSFLSNGVDANALLSDRRPAKSKSSKPSSKLVTKQFVASARVSGVIPSSLKA